MISLPLLEQTGDEEGPTPLKLKLNGKSHRRVLVVDDNEDAGKTLGQWLELQGHSVWVAHSGADGLRLVREWKPEVVLLDIGMPGMDGYEVAGRLRQWETNMPNRKTRLIAVTGYGQPADRERALQAGFDAHLTKPVEHERLKELLG
jgi:CheY-like chemotaxis protein